MSKDTIALALGEGLHDLPLTPMARSRSIPFTRPSSRWGVFDELSAIATGYWAPVLGTCRRYRLPVPLQSRCGAVTPLAAE